MNKSEMVASMSFKTGYTKAEVEKILQSFDETITEGLQTDGRVRLGSLGFMTVKYRDARSGVNLRNPEETYQKPETAVTTFKPSQSLKDIIAEPTIVAAAKERKEKSRKKPVEL